MITIFHLSDFHLNPSHSKDWKTYTRDALVSLLKTEIKNPSSTYIVCTGDLIDKGGKDYGSIGTAFNAFKKDVIEDILAGTGLEIGHFLIVPGNHDIDRYADEDHEPLGLRAIFQKEGVDAVNRKADEFVKNGTLSGAKRVLEYKKFEAGLYDGIDGYEHTVLGSSLCLPEDNSVGFAAFNSAWNVIDDDDFKQGLVLGEHQYNACMNKISSCEVKVALLHHPLDWFRIEKDTVIPKIYKDFDIVLVGHVHEKQTTLVSGWSGTALIDIAPSFSNKIRNNKEQGAFANGFTKIEYSKEDKQVWCSYYTFDFSQDKYVLATDVAENGIWSEKIREKVDPTIRSTIEKSIDSIWENQIPFFNSQLIPQKANAINTVKDAFVLPPIVKINAINGPEYTLSDFLHNRNNQLLFGAHESGKSIVLYSLVQELLENYSQYNVLPAYIDFMDMHNHDIEQIMKLFCDCNVGDMRTLVANGKVVLLVDNYNPTVETKFNAKKLYDYSQKTGIKIIATSSNEVATIPQNFSDNNEIPFEYYYIKQFKAENVKTLMDKWSPEDVNAQRNKKLETLVSRFCSFGLPCTAMSVSLYLWSTESSGKDPVNQAYLLDIYMDIILDKLDTDSIYSNSFDYDNKISLLSNIAEMIFRRYESDNIFTLTYGEYVELVRSYLEDSVGFETFKSDDLADYFIKQRVFNRIGDSISFAHSCFYYFLLAKRMSRNEEFKKYILAEERFYKYCHVIEYYSGLNRSDEALLRLLVDRLEKEFEKYQPIYTGVNFDDVFTKIRVGQESYTPIVEDLDVVKVVRHRPNQKQIEKELIRVSDEKISKITDELSASQFNDPLELIVMLSSALRNLDSVENVDLKYSAYESIVRNSLIYTVIVKELLVRYANAHQFQLPPAYSSIDNIDKFFVFMPYCLQWSLSEKMTSTKLLKIFNRKSGYDMSNKVSNIEEYFTVAMLLDTNGMANEKRVQKFIKKVNRNSVQDYLLNKLVYKYYHLPLTSEQEDSYVDLIATLKVKHSRLWRFQKGKILKEIKADKQQNLALIP